MKAPPQGCALFFFGFFSSAPSALKAKMCACYTCDGNKMMPQVYMFFFQRGSPLLEPPLGTVCAMLVLRVCLFPVHEEARRPPEYISHSGLHLSVLRLGSVSQSPSSSPLSTALT